jgi:hypothetical protein
VLRRQLEVEPPISVTGSRELPHEEPLLFVTQPVSLAVVSLGLQELVQQLPLASKRPVVVVQRRFLMKGLESLTSRLHYH